MRPARSSAIFALRTNSSVSWRPATSRSTKSLSLRFWTILPLPEPRAAKTLKYTASVLHQPSKLCAGFTSSRNGNNSLRPCKALSYLPTARKAPPKIEKKQCPSPWPSLPPGSKEFVTLPPRSARSFAWTRLCWPLTLAFVSAMFSAWTFPPCHLPLLPCTASASPQKLHPGASPLQSLSLASLAELHHPAGLFTGYQPCTALRLLFVHRTVTQIFCGSAQHLSFAT